MCFLRYREPATILGPVPYWLDDNDCDLVSVAPSRFRTRLGRVKRISERFRTSAVRCLLGHDTVLGGLFYGFNSPSRTPVIRSQTGCLTDRSGNVIRGSVCLRDDELDCSLNPFG